MVPSYPKEAARARVRRPRRMDHLFDGGSKARSATFGSAIQRSGSSDGPLL